MQVVYSRSDWFGWRRGAPERGGYYVFLAGFTGVGEGPTLEEAMGDLVRELRAWVEHHDAEHEGYPFTPRSEEPELVGFLRRLFAADSTLEVLCTVLPEAALQPRDEPAGA